MCGGLEDGGVGVRGGMGSCVSYYENFFLDSVNTGWVGIYPRFMNVGGFGV